MGKQQRLIKSRPIPLDFLEAVLEHRQNHEYNVSTFCDDIWRTAEKDKWTEHEMHTTRVIPELVPNDKLVSVLKQNNQQPHKIMCMGEEKVLDDLIKTLENSGQAEKVHLYRSKKTYIEIITKNINKSDALTYLLEKEYSLPMSAVIAFGDNHNDVELLKNAGWGVAVANAKENVKKAADYTSEFTNKENAVAKELIRFLS